MSAAKRFLFTTSSKLPIHHTLFRTTTTLPSSTTIAISATTLFSRQVISSNALLFSRHVSGSSQALLAKSVDDHLTSFMNNRQDNNKNNTVVVDTMNENENATTYLQRDDPTNKALSLLKESTKIYAIAEIKHKPFYFTTNDVLIAPRMKELQLGDVIELDRVRELGSNEFILQGNPYVHPSFFSIKLTVIEHPYSDVNVTVRKKKSGRAIKVHRTGHTKLRVSSISIL